MNYYITVKQDPNLVYANFTGSDLASSAGKAVAELCYEGVYLVSGAPTNTPNLYIPGAIVHNAIDAINYENVGSTASPNFQPMTPGSGFTLPVAETDSSTTTGNSFHLTFSALTSGAGEVLTGPASGLLAGGRVQFIDLGSNTNGAGQKIQTTGVYTGNGLRFIQAGSATTGVLDLIAGNAITTGIIRKDIGGQAAMTTGRYYSANDGTTEVFGIGANGHIHSTVSAVPPTIAVSTQAGITAAAITAGGSDTCGIITTTGTSTGSTILTVTFGKTYTTAPKGVILVPANASAAMPNTGYYVSSVSATTFTITVAAGGTYAATPSFRYMVIA